MALPPRPREWKGVLRSKGFFWVAADHRAAYEWAQAAVSSVNPAGMWWVAVPRQHWTMADGDRPDRQASWDPRYGDRGQELVFIGQKMDELALRAGLDACLLDEKLAQADSTEWTGLPNPFPTLRLPGEAP